MDVTPLETYKAGWRVAVYPMVTSTMDECRARILQGEGERLAVMALKQTLGRGRRGRTWLCPGGAGLLLSVTHRLPESRPPRPGLLAGAAGVAVCEAVRSAAGVPASLKWPNDVLVEDRKLAGVLVETLSAPDGRWAVLGIGVNLTQRAADFPPEYRSSATSLRILTRRAWRETDLLSPLLSELDRSLASPPGELLERWAALDVTCGRPVWVEGSEGRRAAHALRITPTGALRVRWEDGSTSDLHSGDVSLRFRSPSPSL